jgi:DNA-binding transcriptional ArsR family regulator
MSEAFQMVLDEVLAPVARRTDPATSHVAAKRATVNAGTNRALALRLLREAPDGLTDFELAERAGLQQTSIGKRRGELRDQGLVCDSGRRRPAPSGSPAIVWEAT